MQKLNIEAYKSTKPTLNDLPNSNSPPTGNSNSNQNELQQD